MRHQASNPTRRNGFTCDETRDLLAGYALGSLDPAERILVGRHCAACPPCNDALRGYSSTVAYLPLAAPLSAPSPAAKQALFARIAAESPADIRVTDLALEDPVVDSPAAKRRAGRPSDDLPAMPLHGDVPRPTDRSVGARRNLQFAAPFVVLLLLVGGYAFTLNSNLDDAQGEIALLRAAAPVDGAAIAAADLAGASVAVTDASAPIVGQPLIALDTTSESTVTDSASVVGPTDSRCQILGYQDGVFVLHINNMRVPNADRTAGVFVVDRAGIETLVHTFTVAEDGSVATDFVIDRPLADIVSVHVVPMGVADIRGAKGAGRAGFFFSLVYVSESQTQPTSMAIGS
jgi:hypothetical protein